MKRSIITAFAVVFGLFVATAQQSTTTPSQSASQSNVGTEMTVDSAATAGGLTSEISTLPPHTADALWDQANTAYHMGDFHTAVATYEQILAQGLSSMKLYYNLANAYFKEGRSGKAILYYHRALRLAPGNEDIRYNLRVAETRTKDKIEDIPEFFFTTWMRDVRHTMSCAAWTILSLVFLVCALSLLLFYLLSQRLSLRKTGFYGTLLSCLLFVCATYFAVGERSEMLDLTTAVIMPASVAVKSSPDRSATDLFVLHEGTVVKVTDRLEGWCEVVIADGKKGWLESTKIETI